MFAKKMKWSPPRATSLATIAVAALVVACDAEAPTAIDGAMRDVLANPEAAADADGSGNPVSEVIKGTLGGGPPPLLFVDGVEVRNPDSSLHGWLDPGKRIGVDVALPYPASDVLALLRIPPSSVDRRRHRARLPAPAAVRRPD